MSDLLQVTWALLWGDVELLRYIFQKPNHDMEISWWTAIVCRVRGHPAGVVWYNSGRDEPDMHCRNCYDDLG